MPEVDACHSHGECSEDAGCHDDACDSTSGSAIPEIEASLPRQTRVKAWEATEGLSNRPTRDEPPPAPDRIHRRWDRFVRLVGNDQVRTLLGSHVTIFGLGGVGSYVAEALARSAVGRLTLVDFDDVCITNVNRQLQAFPATVGQSKALLLAERVRAIHPEAWVDPIQAFYEASTSGALLTPRPDFVVDAIDNVTSKVLLLETCLKLGIPVISITGAGARLDPTQGTGETRLRCRRGNGAVGRVFRRRSSPAGSSRVGSGQGLSMHLPASSRLTPRLRKAACHLWHCYVHDGRLRYGGGICCDQASDRPKLKQASH